jgi:hypothetical protein
MDRVLREIPDSWLPGDERDQLTRLLETLLRRRKRLESLIEGCTQGRVNPFPNWQQLIP